MTKNNSKKIKSLETYNSLPTKQQKAVAMMFRSGVLQSDVANEIGVNPATISVWKTQERFRTAQDEYNHFMLRDMAHDAADTMHKLLKARSELVRFNAAKDILDRTGYAPVEQQEIKMDARDVVTIHDDIGDES